MKLSDIGTGLGILMVAIMGGFFLWLMFAMVPVMMYTEAECLRKGYPKSYVTVGLERYCSNLVGDITVKVDKAGHSSSR
jgi:hypothetical protein